MQISRPNYEKILLLHVVPERNANHKYSSIHPKTMERFNSRSAAASLRLSPSGSLPPQYLLPDFSRPIGKSFVPCFSASYRLKAVASGVLGIRTSNDPRKSLRPCFLIESYEGVIYVVLI